MPGPSRCLISPFSVLIFLLIICSLALGSCESDPVLAPQSSEEEDNGSYGTSNLLGGTAARHNPELF